MANFPIPPFLDKLDERSIRAYLEQVRTTANDVTTFWSTFIADTGSTTANTNDDALTISGGEGIDTSISGDTVTIAGEDATITNKGIASFVTADFTVSSGAVTIKDSGIDHDATTNFVANEHIDWTSTSSNFDTSGTIQGTSISFDNGTNALAAYEEGTFTPVLAGISAAGAGTYTEQTGRYTVIGRLCYIYLKLIWTAHTGTGNMKITSLPKTSLDSDVSHPMSVFHENITGTAGETLSIYATQNSTELTINAIDFSAAAASITLDTAATITVSGFYEI